MQRTKTRGRRLALALSCLVSWGQVAMADETPRVRAPAVEGWTIAPMADGTACLASGPSDTGARLNLGAKGKGFVMLVVAPDLPATRASFPATFGFDDRLPETAAATQIGGAMGFMISPREPIWRPMTSEAVTVTRRSAWKPISSRTRF